MPSPRRVVVTGLGVVGPCGIGRDAFWNGLLGPAPEGDRLVHDFDPTVWLGPKEARRTDRFAQMAIGAAEMALEQSGATGADPDRSGVIMGTGVGGLETLEDQIVVRFEKGEKRVSPFLVPMMMANAGAASLSMRFGWRGPCETTVTACAASTHAIGNAMRLIRWGICDAVMTGGSEASITPTALAGFGNMTALSPDKQSKPFDKDRNGFVIAEGAAVLVLEEREAALARGATILGEITGAASTADAHHITASSPDVSGAVRAMELAIADAGVSASDIKQINAHGTSTPL
ncbi:MAG: 3-oxoacyl-[acyl-carrier-protein] synthase, partial [Actinomycetota bacterium]